MYFKSFVLGALVSCALLSPAAAGDLVVKPRVQATPHAPQHLCVRGKSIFSDLAYSEIVAAVTAYHDEAVAAAEQSQYSRSMRYNWALETKAWCGSAIGYSWTRTLDEETVAKCACFHYTMIRQR